MSLLASQVTALTRQVGRISLQQRPNIAVLARAFPRATIGAVNANCSSSELSIRSFATKKKTPSAAKAVSKTSDTSDDADKRAALQHEEWVKFQKSIAVQGFETGQTVEVRAGNKKARGGKARRKTGKSELEERIAERQRLTDVGGGEYPPLRYSDEETERLLAEAYAAVPERGGKRGTRNLKKQKRRWHLVRTIRKKYKYHMSKAQTRKMEKRSRKIKLVKGVLQEAPGVRVTDREYQAQVFERWAANMVEDQEQDGLVDDVDGTFEEAEGTEKDKLTV